jgi:hypothetical protein
MSTKPAADPSSVLDADAFQAETVALVGGITTSACCFRATAFGSLAPMNSTVVPTDNFGTGYQFTSHYGRRA